MAGGRCGPRGASPAALLCDTTADTQPLPALRPSLIGGALRVAFAAELAVLALVLGGMTWLALVLLARFAV